MGSLRSTPYGLGNETEELARGLAAILANDSEESISLYDRELPTERWPASI